MDTRWIRKWPERFPSIIAFDLPVSLSLFLLPPKTHPFPPRNDRSIQAIEETDFTGKSGVQQHYPRIRSLDEENNYASLPAELSSFACSSLEPRQEAGTVEGTPARKGTVDRSNVRPRPNESSFQELAGTRRKIGSTDVFGQNMENLVQLDDPCAKRKFAKSLDEIREEPSRRHARSVLGLEHLIVGSDENPPEEEGGPRCPARTALRRNQSFDHSRCQS